MAVANRQQIYFFEKHVGLVVKIRSSINASLNNWSLFDFMACNSQKNGERMNGNYSSKSGSRGFLMQVVA